MDNDKNEEKELTLYLIERNADKINFVQLLQPYLYEKMIIMYDKETEKDKTDIIFKHFKGE